MADRDYTSACLIDDQSHQSAFRSQKGRGVVALAFRRRATLDCVTHRLYRSSCARSVALHASPRARSSSRGCGRGLATSASGERMCAFEHVDSSLGRIPLLRLSSVDCAASAAKMRGDGTVWARTRERGYPVDRKDISNSGPAFCPVHLQRLTTISNRIHAQ